MSTSGSPSSSSPYRNEIDALNQRKSSLEQEIARLKTETAQLEGLRTREQELERELSQVAQKLHASAPEQQAARRRRALPMLDHVKVASPCNASWDEMLGDDRVRFCVSCEKNVYNLSAMPRQDAEQLLADRVGSEMCVRFYQRADGTIMTQDCPVGVKKKQRKKLALAIAGAGAMALAGASMLAAAKTKCGMTQGEMMPIDPQQSSQNNNVQPQPYTQPNDPPDEGTMRMGDWAGPPPTTPHVMGTAAPINPPTPTPPVHPVPKMGRRAK